MASPITTLALLLFVTGASFARAQELPRGTIVDSVTCAGDSAQTYALYLPSNYSPERSWSVLMAFHPSARGRLMVEKYRAAAEQYGYIVAGSNNSRNGSWAVSAAAVRAMSADLAQRFSIDADRVYLTGMSGGARVALQVALGTSKIAGVIASSAAYPDSRPRATLPFPVFATAGTEDFNYVEMRQLDRSLKSPHRLAIFTGGHTLPPDEVALDAIEWLELQAIKSGARVRDDAFLDRHLEKEQRLIGASTSDIETMHALENVVADFKGLRDVAREEARLADLSRQPEVKKALARERSDDEAELGQLREVFDLEAGLQNADTRQATLAHLHARLGSLARAANAPENSPGRSQARRVLRVITSGVGERIEDLEYRTLLEQYRQGPR
ncbi:MAG TPA: hypothetical protein VEK56_16990 [Vicinamibacterales bacterium]|nr:hypothetical protein [Vicinamibacterales bacterium]